MEPKKDGKMLILAHNVTKNPRINKLDILDDNIYIVDSKGDVIWKWSASEHFSQFGFTDAAVNKMQSLNWFGGKHGGVDWIHINCASWLGRTNGMMRATSAFIRTTSSATAATLPICSLSIMKPAISCGRLLLPLSGLMLRWLRSPGVHGTHMIPKGLPGEGNILLFDNGGTMPGDMYGDTQAHALEPHHRV